MPRYDRSNRSWQPRRVTNEARVPSSLQTPRVQSCFGKGAARVSPSPLCGEGPGGKGGRDVGPDALSTMVPSFPEAASLSPLADARHPPPQRGEGETRAIPLPEQARCLRERRTPRLFLPGHSPIPPRHAYAASGHGTIAARRRTASAIRAGSRRPVRSPCPHSRRGIRDSPARAPRAPGCRRGPASRRGRRAGRAPGTRREARETREGQVIGEAPAVLAPGVDHRAGEAGGGERRHVGARRPVLGEQDRDHRTTGGQDQARRVAAGAQAILR